MTSKLSNQCRVVVPLTVPAKLRKTFIKNYLRITENTGRLFLFAGDQKIEHLNEDFYGKGISAESANPRHLFEIASKGRIGVFATHLGLIARYGSEFKKTIRYIVKLNAKTKFIPVSQEDPRSALLTTVEQVIAFRQKSKLDIVGVGYTLYLGSRYERKMLAEVAEIIMKAHENGLIVIVWIYPRGKAVVHERSVDVIAGAAGVGVSLGADFIKVNPPDAANILASAQLLKQVTRAAGNTKVICSGGSRKDKKVMLQEVYHQIHSGGAAGVAIGRNLHQRSLREAIAFSQALASIIIDDKNVKTAEQFL